MFKSIWGQQNNTAVELLNLGCFAAPSYKFDIERCPRKLKVLIEHRDRKTS